MEHDGGHSMLSERTRGHERVRDLAHERSAKAASLANRIMYGCDHHLRMRGGLVFQLDDPAYPAAEIVALGNTFAHPRKFEMGVCVDQARQHRDIAEIDFVLG